MYLGKSPNNQHVPSFGSTRASFASTLVLLIIFIAGLHIAAMRFNLYFSIWWFDIPMHFLGGLWSGLFVIFYSLLRTHSRGEAPSHTRVLCVGLGAAIVFGLAWELYEYLFGFTFTTKSSYGFDTIVDMILDMLGGLTAGAYTLSNGLFRTLRHGR